MDPATGSETVVSALGMTSPRTRPRSWDDERRWRTGIPRTRTSAGEDAANVSHTGVDGGKVPTEKQTWQETEADIAKLEEESGVKGKVAEEFVKSLNLRKLFAQFDTECTGYMNKQQFVRFVEHVNKIVIEGTLGAHATRKAKEDATWSKD